MRTVFINYRRADSSGHARLLHRDLCRDGLDVFMDIDGIVPGADFVQVIEEALARCDAVLAVIGPRWLAQDGDGNRRLDAADDHVRFEVEVALRRGVRVIPVLVGGARMPDAADLPATLAPLARRNAVELHDTSAWTDEVERLRASLLSAAAPVAPLAAPSGLVAGGTVPTRHERKPVTAMVARAITSGQLDLEDRLVLQEQFHEAVRTAVALFGGRVERATGWRVVAVFGAPSTREDDAARAVRAGLAACDAIAAIGRGLVGRVGVETGEALVALDGRPGSGEELAAGGVADEAERLTEDAEAGQVVVGPAAIAVTRTRIAYDTAGARAIAIGPREPGLGGGAAPIVGRDAELAELAAAFERVCAERRPRLVTVLGEAGIGKSRLVAEFARQQVPAPRAFEARVQQFGEGALQPLASIVRAVCGIGEADGPDAALTTLRDAAAAYLEPADVRFVVRQLAVLLDLAGADGAGGSLDDAFSGWRLFLAAAARSMPLVIVIEDVHWAEAVLLDFLAQLVARSDDAPLLVVVTARPTLNEDRPDWGHGPRTQTLELRELDRTEIGLLVDVAAGTGLDERSRDALIDQSGGNALYALEYARTVQESGAAPGGALPATIAGIIAARLDGLPPDEKAIVQDAAVLGETSWLGALCVLGDRDLDTAELLVERLERRQLLRRVSRSAIRGDVELRLSHALVADVAYRQLTRHDRAQRHRAAADWVDQRVGAAAPTGMAQLAELAAYHLTRACTLATELGEQDDGLRDRARTALMQAISMAEERRDDDTVARYATQALELAPPPDQRARLLVARAIAERHVGAEHEAALREAYEAASTAGHDEDAIKVLLRLTYVTYGQPAEVGYFEEATARAERLPLSPLTCNVFRLGAYDLLKAGRVSEAIAYLEPHIARAGATGDATIQALLQSVRGHARIDAGDAGGADEMREAFQVLDVVDDRRAWHAGGNLALGLFALGRATAALDTFQTCLTIARRQGDPHGEADTLHYLAWLRYHATGDPAAARLVAEAEQVAATYGTPIGPDIALSKGWIVSADQPDLALETATRALESDTWSHDQMRIVECHALRVWALLCRESSELPSAVDRFLAAWNAWTAKNDNPALLAHAAIGLAVLERHDDIKDAAAVLAATPWTTALAQLSARHPGDAAATFETIPSVPLRVAALRIAAGS